MGLGQWARVEGEERLLGLRSSGLREQWHQRPGKKGSAVKAQLGAAGTGKVWFKFQVGAQAAQPPQPSTQPQVQVGISRGCEQGAGTHSDMASALVFRGL